MGCSCNKLKSKPKKESLPYEIHTVVETKPLEKLPSEEPAKIEIVELEYSADIRKLYEQRFLYTLEFMENNARFLEYNITLHKLNFHEMPDNLYVDCGMTEIPDGNLILAGGIEQTRSEEVACCFMIDTKKYEITKLSPMKTSKRRVRLIYHDNYVYAIGGVREKLVQQQNLRGIRLDYSNSFERFSLETSSWEDLKDLPRGVEFPGCFVLSHNMYVTGGCYISGVESQILDLVQIYSLDTHTWLQHTIELPIALYTHMCANLENNSVLIFGGVDEEDENNYECFIFDGSSFIPAGDFPEKAATAFPYYSVMFNNEVITYNDDSVIFTYSVSSDTWYTTCLNSDE